MVNDIGHNITAHGNQVFVTNYALRSSIIGRYEVDAKLSRHLSRKVNTSPCEAADELKVIIDNVVHAT